MIFGNRVDAARSIEPSTWIAERCRGVWGTVGALVPNDYPSVLRLHAPDQDLDDWWGAYRRVFTTIAEVGERHTASPDDGWFAVWEGYGFASGTKMYVWSESDDPDDAAATAVAAEQERLRAHEQRRRAEIPEALSRIPRFDLPHRAYFLLGGPVGAVADLRDPGTPDRWQRPDLFWPDDRRWFVATDVDFWSLYVGGDHDFVAELTQRVDVPCEIVTLGHRLGAED